MVHCGRREESYCYCEYDSTEAYEPADRVQQENVAPDYSTQPYLEIPRSLPEIVVSTRYRFVFQKQEESKKHFAGMVLPTNKNYEERGHLIVDNGATRMLTRSLFTMSSTEIVKIQLAGDGMSIKWIQSGKNTHDALDTTGQSCQLQLRHFMSPTSTKMVEVGDIKYWQEEH